MPQHPAVADGAIDPFVKYLNERGYQPILVAVGGLLPPMVCILDPKQKRFEFRYELKDVLLPGAKAPEAKEVAAIDMQKEKVTEANGKLSIGFMGKVAAFFCMEGPKVDLAADMDKGATFNFSNVTCKAVLLGLCTDALNESLNEAKIPNDDDMKAGLVHIAYDFLYSSSLTREYNDNKGFAGEAGGAVPQAVSLGLAAHYKNKNGELEKYDEAKHPLHMPVAIAFKVAQMQYTPKGITLKGVLTDAEGLGEREEDDPYLAAPQAVIDFMREE